MTTQILLLPKARYTGSEQAEKHCYQDLVQYLGYLYPKAPEPTFLSLPKQYRENPTQWISDAIDYCVQYEMALPESAVNTPHNLFFSVLLRDFSQQLLEQVIHAYERQNRPLPDNKAFSLRLLPEYHALSAKAVRYLATAPFVDLSEQGPALLYLAYFTHRDLGAAHILLNQGVRIRHMFPRINFNPDLVKLRHDKTTLYSLFLSLVEELRVDGIHPDDREAGIESDRDVHVPLLFTALKLAMPSVVSLLVNQGANPQKRSGWYATGHDGSVVNSWWYEHSGEMSADKQIAMFQAMRVTPSAYQKTSMEQQRAQTAMA